METLKSNHPGSSFKLINLKNEEVERARAVPGTFVSLKWDSI
jgi:hypothetical protein